MHDKRTTRVVITTALLLLLPAIYVLSYVALIRPVEDSSYEVRARYAAGGRTSEIAFLPANWVDRRMRPQRWTLTLEERIERLQKELGKEGGGFGTGSRRLSKVNARIAK